MAGRGRDGLRRFLVDSYDDLKSRLTRRLGSADLAGEVLHETWLRLDRAAVASDVRSPRLYLLRVALNIAWKRLKAEPRTLTLSDAKAAMGIADEAPDAARATLARLDLQALGHAMAELTPRRRQVLLASRLEGIPLREIAIRLGISQRLVELELKHALAHCALRLDKTVTQRFGPRPRQGSDDMANNARGEPGGTKS
ncbi:RNA polymerase sigma factor [Reyranella sp. CPCC 100927]|nr:RNA polymerase sigma factor [Reyranella sp. CPCC 100927]